MYVGSLVKLKLKMSRALINARGFWRDQLESSGLEFLLLRTHGESAGIKCATLTSSLRELHMGWIGACHDHYLVP